MYHPASPTAEEIRSEIPPGAPTQEELKRRAAAVLVDRVDGRGWSRGKDAPVGVIVPSLREGGQYADPRARWEIVATDRVTGLPLHLGVGG
jgi:hypothetical protein